MVHNNIFEIVNIDGFPSLRYLTQKKVLDFQNLWKTISLKEIEFTSCNRYEHDYALQSVQLEKELGELYVELMTFVKTLNIIPNV